jgi:hypothetical protein
VPPRHAPKTDVAFGFGCFDEGSGDIVPVVHDLAQGVDGSGADVWVGVVPEEVQRSRHPEVLTGTACVLFAAIARQRVKRPSADSWILVVERNDQIRE